MMQTKSKTKKRFINLIIFLAIILLSSSAFFKILSDGFHIQKISIADVKLVGLYLKLDKKLTLSIDKIDLSQTLDSPSEKFDTQKAISWIQRTVLIISYFQELSIKEIVFSNKGTASILFDGKKYEILFPNIHAIFKITDKSNVIDLDIEKLSLNELKISMEGKFKYTIPNEKINFDLSTYYDKKPQEKIFLNGSSDLNTLNLNASSTDIENIDFLQKEIYELDKDIYEWIYDKAKYTGMKINYLKFSTSLDKYFYKKLLKTLKADIQVNKPDLTLETGLNPIQAQKVNIIFNDSKMTFDISEPTYENIDLSKSKVVISNMSEGNPTIDVYIKSINAVLDERIHKILKAYDVDFDVNQYTSKSNVDLKISIKTLQDSDPLVSVNGIIKSENTNVSVYGVPLFSQNLNVVLDINTTSKHVYIGDTNVKHKDMFDGLANLDIDIENEKISGKVLPKYIKIYAGSIDANAQLSPMKKIVDIQDGEINALYPVVDFSSLPIKIDIPSLGVNMQIDEQKNIHISDLSKLYTYSPLLKHLDIKEGEVSINTKDFEDFDINAFLINLKYPIYSANWSKIDSLNMKLSVKNGDINAVSEKIQISIKDNIKLKLTDSNFNINELENSNIPLLKSLGEDSSTSNVPIFIELENTRIAYKKYILPADGIYISYNNNKLKADISYGNGIANIDADTLKNVVVIKASNFSGNFINLVAKKKIAEGGLFSLNGVYRRGVLKANVDIQNTVLKNFALLQNIVGLIDTIPSLIVFRKPGLGINGYQIKNGNIDFSLNKDYLGINQIKLIGDSIDIEGRGLITLKSEEINMALSISTIKSLSDILNKIPVVGYLLLGKEGKISTSMVISGTVENPNTKINLAEDVITAPFKIIQRIFNPKE